MKQLCLILILFGCMFFSSKVLASSVDVTTPTVDAILDGTTNENSVNPESNLGDSSDGANVEEDDYEDEDLDDELLEEEEEIYNPMEYIDQELFPYHSLTEVGSKATKKGFELVKLVQIAGYIIVTIVFVIAVIFIAINKGTNSNNSVGWGALIICVICYILIFIGPSLLEWFKNWAVS